MTISKGQDVVDSRDVIARIKELEDERETLQEALDEAREDPPEPLEEGEDTQERQNAAISKAELSLADWDDDNGEELKELKKLADECEGYGDWEHGATLIHESYWVEYVEEMLIDIGDLPKDIPNYIAIDWEKTADNIAVDYHQVNWGGETYYLRS